MSTTAHISMPVVSAESSVPPVRPLGDTDPLLSAIGIAKDLWADEHADEYVANLRKDW